MAAATLFVGLCAAIMKMSRQYSCREVGVLSCNLRKVATSGGGGMAEEIMMARRENVIYRAPGKIRKINEKLACARFVKTFAVKFAGGGARSSCASCAEIGGMSYMTHRSIRHHACRVMSMPSLSSRLKNKIGHQKSPMRRLAACVCMRKCLWRSNA